MKNFLNIKMPVARMLLTMLCLLVVGVGQMWGDNEYQKRYLYVNSSNCSWWTDDSAQPALNAYWDGDCTNGDIYRLEADGGLTSTSWYFDLSTMNESYLYFRGFKVQRHPKNTSNYWNPVTLAVGSGTHNCLWISSAGNSMSWGYYAVPISSIALSATSGYLSGSGTSGDPYLVPLGTSISLSATPTCTPADNTMSFCANFGTSPAANPTTVTSTNSFSVTTTSKQEVKCVGRNKYGDVYSADVTSNSVYVQGVVPSVGVSAAGSVTTTTATLNATVTVNGATTTAYGFKYGTTNNVSTLQASGTNASTSGALAANATSFSKRVTSLSPNTTYYYISYVTTASGTYYSASTQSFTTLSAAEETHNVTVYYKCGDSSIGVGSVTESSVGVTTSRSVTAPSITGYTFSSWTLDDGLTNMSANTTTNPISIVTKSTGTYTLTANYTLNSHNVIFNANGGSGSMSNESFNYNETKALTTNAYTRTGYTFKGWATSSARATAGTVDYADGANYTMADADVTLYAVWWTNLYFVCETAETTIKAHVWYTESTTDYPYKAWASDDEMTNTGNSVNGRTIYSYSFPECYNKAIFRYGDSKTGDLTSFTAGNYYYYNGTTGTWYASVSAIREAWKVYGSWNETSGAWNSNDFASYGESTATYTVDLSAATQYSFKYVFAGTNTWYGQTGSSDVADGATTTLSGDNNVTFTSTVAGTYTFTINYSSTTPTAKVDFPTSYTLTYAIGTVAGTEGSISTSPSTSSGTQVRSGNTVTLTAPAAKTGYTWKGWYTNAAGTTGKIADTDRAITVTMNADTTLYACYTEDSYTVTVNASSGGTVSYGAGAASSSCSASAGVATASNTIHAIPDDGYAFIGWTGVSADNHITDYTATWNSTNEGWDLTVNADAATTITANFAPRFALKGSISADGDPLGGMPGWSDIANTTYSTGTYTVTRSLTNPNTTYKFQIIDLRHEDWTYRGYTSSSNNLAVDNSTTYTLSGTNDVYFDSKGVGNYTFTIVEEEVEDVIYPKVKIQDGANSHVITWGYVSDNGQEGGTITSVVDGEATPNAIASGKYVKDGGSITVTAAANSGYRFIDFRTSSTFGSGSQLSTSSPYEVASVTADQNIYAQFAENLCTVTITANNTAAGTITVGGDAFTWGNTTQVGVYTTKALVVTPAAGYYFSGWTLSDTPDFAVGNSGESGSSTTLSGLGGTHGSTGTLTANFVELDKVYFRNIFDDGAGNVTSWSNVYVYFDYTWDGTKVKTKNDDTYRASMTQIESSDVYWAYVPRAFTSAGGNRVAFSDTEFAKNYTFYNASASGSNGAARGDYSNLLNMFVPYHVANKTNDNGVDYYDNGYWMKYDTRASQGAGYYLKVYNSRNNYTQKGEFIANTDDATTIQFRVRVDNTGADYTKFMITSAGGLNYVADATVTAAACTDVEVSENTNDLASNDVYFQLNATSEGYYTFILDQTSDKMKLSVVYPAAIGDYRVVYSSTTPATNRYTDVIKRSDAAQTTTMYVNYSATGAALKLEQCTDITDGNPVWTEVTGQNQISAFSGKTKGVYKFDITVTPGASTGTAGGSFTVSNIESFTGPYYIKTDCASGGWVNYTQNAMTQNTINFSTSVDTTFDYYFCQYIGNTTTNVKFVVATDYNNAVSDTIATDAVISKGDNYETLPAAASVRFSYNTSTGVAKRAYMSSVSVKPNTTGMVYSEQAKSNDLSAGAALTDNANWTYRKDVWVVPGAQAGIRTTYDGNNYDLVATTTELMGGSGSTAYNLRVVYDFKTNHLTAGWLIPESAVSSATTLNADMMIIRNGQDAAQQLTFDGGSLSSVKQIYGVMEFKYNDYITYRGGRGGTTNLERTDTYSTWDSTDYRLNMFYISFPFDVKMSDIFGIEGYDTYWDIQKYNGAKRAEDGFFRGDGTTTFWETLTMDSTLHAYEGYLLRLSRRDFYTADENSDGYNDRMWTSIGSGGSIFLYFPSSNATAGSISSTSKTITVPAHTCLHDRTFDNGSGTTVNHANTDSHWNMIGTPLFENKTASTVSAGGTFTSYYAWDSENNTWGAESTLSTSSVNFPAMGACMVQFCGTITFSGATFSSAPARMLAEQTADTHNYHIELQLRKDEQRAAKTFITLRENAVDSFLLNEDMYMAATSKNATVYSFAGNYDCGANVMSIANHIVPVGVNVTTAGEYTFSMPSVFDGSVELVDTQLGTRTNLLLNEYTIDLPAGMDNNRFYLDIRIDNVVTSIENLTGEGTNSTNHLNDGKPHKFVRNGQLYILRNGVVYDSTGKIVE